MSAYPANTSMHFMQNMHALPSLQLSAVLSGYSQFDFGMVLQGPIIILTKVCVCVLNRICICMCVVCIGRFFRTHLGSICVHLSDPRTDPEVIKKSCSTQLSMNFSLLINVKMPTIFGILTFMSRKNGILGLSALKEITSQID